MNKVPYSQRSREELLTLKSELEAEFEKVKALGLKLDMSRGKPSKEQLDLSRGLFDVFDSSSVLEHDGIDCLNYGVLSGIPKARRLMAEICEVSDENVIVYGNSSLTAMFDCVSRSFTHGIMGNTPWCRLDKVKFLCPVPGYDRHFAITQSFGVEMIPIPMNDEGPDMDLVEKLVSEDEAVKGIWCVPKYSNPSGVCYSDETVRRFAHLKPAAKDFRIYWDNAYGIHHMYEDDQVSILEILEECKKAGNPDMVYKFMSTSKITFPGSGVAALYASEANIKDIEKVLTVQTIGFDKVNQLRHVRFFKNLDNLKDHMMKHAAVIRPRFEAVWNALDEIDGLKIATWTKPKGGYFISFNGLPGTAKAIVALMKEAGVIMTGAGATYPYGIDPEDSNIRIAPTMPDLEEIQKASEIFVLCVKLASVRKLLEA